MIQRLGLEEIFYNLANFEKDLVEIIFIGTLQQIKCSKAEGFVTSGHNIGRVSDPIQPELDRSHLASHFKFQRRRFRALIPIWRG